MCVGISHYPEKASPLDFKDTCRQNYHPSFSMSIGMNHYPEKASTSDFKDTCMHPALSSKFKYVYWHESLSRESIYLRLQRHLHVAISSKF